MENNIISVVQNDVLYLDNLTTLSDFQTLRQAYNAIVLCKSGTIGIELGLNNKVTVKQGQLLLVPARKAIQSMSTSDDLNVEILLLSDLALKSILVSQISIWNKALYTKEFYVVPHSTQLDEVSRHAQSVIMSEARQLQQDIVLSFLRLMLLLICEELLNKEKESSADSPATERDRVLFNRFLELLSVEKQKHKKVTHYAKKLCITAKYLSSVSQRASGKSPIRWIAEYTMEDSFTMLRDTDMSIKEISDILGFPNSSFFGHFFRKQSGMTPVEYRSKYHQNL